MLPPLSAAPAVAHELHEQAMRRLRDLTALVLVELPTMRLQDATPEARRLM